MPDLPIIPGVQPVILVDYQGNPIDFTGDGRIKATLSDGTTEVAVDGDSAGLTVIEAEHAHIHAGRHFVCGDEDGDVDIAGPKYWHVKNNQSAKSIHLTVKFVSSFPGLLEIFENPTLSNDGTPLVEFNSNRNSGVVAVAELFSDPTVGADGARIIPEVIGSDQNGPGGSGVGAVGGIRKRSHEIELKNSESYLVKFTSKLDDARVSVEFNWYEVTE